MRPAGRELRPSDHAVNGGAGGCDTPARHISVPLLPTLYGAPLRPLHRVLRLALQAELISWASHSGIPEFAALARTLKGFRQLIWNTLDHRLSNGHAKGINTQLAALTARARGFHGAAAVIAMANLTGGGLCPPLPGR